MSNSVNSVGHFDQYLDHFFPNVCTLDKNIKELIKDINSPNNKTTVESLKAKLSSITTRVNSLKMQYSGYKERCGEDKVNIPLAIQNIEKELEEKKAELNEMKSKLESKAPFEKELTEFTINTIKLEIEEYNNQITDLNNKLDGSSKEFPIASKLMDQIVSRYDGDGDGGIYDQVCKIENIALKKLQHVEDFSKIPIRVVVKNGEVVDVKTSDSLRSFFQGFFSNR